MTIGSFELDSIVCGDSYKLIKELPDKCIDLVIIDPPYEMVCGGHGSGSLADRKTAQNDSMRNFGLYDGFKNEILDELVRVMKKINIYIWCSKNQIYQILDYFNKLDKNLNFDLLTWHKTNPVPLANMTYMNDTEYCINFREVGCVVRGNLEDKKKYWVTPINKRDKDKFSHFTIKPLNIIETLVINGSDEDDIVLDCFLGSGTTAVACKNLNRHYLGFEINEEYYKIAVDRLNNTDQSGQYSMFTV